MPPKVIFFEDKKYRCFRFIHVKTAALLLSILFIIKCLVEIIVEFIIPEARWLIIDITFSLIISISFIGGYTSRKHYVLLIIFSALGALGFLALAIFHLVCGIILYLKFYKDFLIKFENPILKDGRIKIFAYIATTFSFFSAFLLIYYSISVLRAYLYSKKIGIARNVIFSRPITQPIDAFQNQNIGTFGSAGSWDEPDIVRRHITKIEVTPF
uniref:Uncharacterized protein n=1 Tax=Acrobeloides nanus TaxID=290746 RepID=A0A914C973_9BILA